MATKKKTKHSWSFTEIRKSLAQALKASATHEQVIEVKGEPRAVLIDFETWQKLKSNEREKKDLKNLWESLGTLNKPSKRDEPSAYEDFPRLRVKDPFSEDVV